MKSPTLARHPVGADTSEFARAELKAFVALSKRERPYAWSLVNQLQRACRRESLATAVGIERPVRLSGERTAA